jgi:hypothetical protein
MPVKAVVGGDRCARDSSIREKLVSDYVGTDEKTKRAHASRSKPIVDTAEPSAL